MRFKKLMVMGIAAMAVVGSVTGAALASSRGTKAPSKPATSAITTADTDNVQEGDQTSPDNPSQAPEVGAAATSESSGESDGPGGHEDPPGDVNHEFDGEE